MTQQIFSDLMPSLRLQHSVITLLNSEKIRPQLRYGPYDGQGLVIEVTLALRRMPHDRSELGCVPVIAC